MVERSLVCRIVRISGVRACAYFHQTTSNTDHSLKPSCTRLLLSTGIVIPLSAVVLWLQSTMERHSLIRVLVPKSRLIIQGKIHVDITWRHLLTAGSSPSLILLLFVPSIHCLLPTYLYIMLDHVSISHQSTFNIFPQS